MALDRSHQVTAFVRDTEKLVSKLGGVASNGLKITTGAIDDSGALAAGMSGHDAVINAAGNVNDGPSFTRLVRTAIGAAAEALGVRDLIDDLPGGFEARVGEKGSGLSLGQRQVICFARAMLADPRILILDEATSSVDAVTEARLQRALSKLLSGRTSFVVAHRLSTIRHADLVLVLDRGQIVARGTHAVLLAHDGRYAQM